jgi:hypothetical protein
MATITDVTITTSTTPILTVANRSRANLWNPGPGDVDIHLQGPAGVADDITIAEKTGIQVPAYQRVDGIVASGTGTIQILRGVRPGG